MDTLPTGHNLPTWAIAALWLTREIFLFVLKLVRSNQAAKATTTAEETKGNTEWQKFCTEKFNEIQRQLHNIERIQDKLKTEMAFVKQAVFGTPHKENDG